MKNPETLRRFLRVLANPARQDILLLFARGERRSVGEIAERMKIAVSTASEHLAALRQAGVLLAEKEGKAVYYRPHIAGLRGHLDAFGSYLSCCCPQLDAVPPKSQTTRKA